MPSLKFTIILLIIGIVGLFYYSTFPQGRTIALTGLAIIFGLGILGWIICIKIIYNKK